MDKSPKVNIDKKLKKVSFSLHTAAPVEVPIAVSMPSYQLTHSKGFTEYTVQIWQNGSLWTVRKRYRDFEQLHNLLLMQFVDFKNELPELPKKRWFQSQRWLNRNDPAYELKRLLDLQNYLRMLIRVPLLIELSESLRQFLNVTKLPPFDDVIEVRYMSQDEEITAVVYDSFDCDNEEEEEEDIEHMERNEMAVNDINVYSDR